MERPGSRERSSELRVVLIANYLPDEQQSMRRYAESLCSDLVQAGVSTVIWHPPVLAGRLARHSRLVKWAGYVDKLLIFPLVLALRARRFERDHRGVVFHVCDHSNSPWLAALPPDRTLITCHDVLAIQGARGDRSARAPASPTGRILQAWIAHYLVRARYVSCVSAYTLTQLEALHSREPSDFKPYRTVIRNGLNADFTAVPTTHANRLLTGAGLATEEPYLLHVGSGHARKNRAMLARVCDPTLGDEAWTGSVVFAGAPIDSELRQVISELGVETACRSVPHPDHDLLVALYQCSSALVFPSFSEGFGWPIIEAQKCGTVVVASDRPVLREVAGDGAVFGDPDDVNSFAQAVRAATEATTRTTRLDQGRLNAARFDNSSIADEYVNLYCLIAAGSVR